CIEPNSFCLAISNVLSRNSFHLSQFLEHWLIKDQHKAFLQILYLEEDPCVSIGTVWELCATASEDILFHLLGRRICKRGAIVARCTANNNGMKKILLAGASGPLGMEVAKCLAHAFIPFRALVNSEDSAEQLRGYTQDLWIADAQDPDELKGMCEGVSHVFSSLGESVSLFTGGNGDYEDIDYKCNRNILQEAEMAGVHRFVYCSILGSEPENKLHLAQVHYKVQELL